MSTHTIHFGFVEIPCGEYIYSIFAGDTPRVKALLAGGQDPFARDSCGGTPFFWASFTRDPELVQVIANAQIQNGGIQGLDPLHLVNALPVKHPLDTNEMRCFELLLNLVPDRPGVLAAGPQLWEKAAFCELPVIELLLDHGIPSDYRREGSGNSLFHDLCKHGRLDVLKRLSATTSRLNGVNASGQTPLRVAIDSVLIDKRQAVLPLIQYLLKQNARIEPPLTPEEHSVFENLSA